MRSLLSLLIFFICAPTEGAARAGAPPARTNIVLLLTDDQRADCLGCAGHPLLKTPNIDRLARQGVRFKNAFVTTSICCVSRASILTGRYPRKHKVADFQTPLAPDMELQTFLALLKRANYYVGVFGKWGIGGPAPKHLADVWDAWGDQGPYFHLLGAQKVHNSEWLTRKAIDFLARSPGDRPFCLVVYYKAPHEPYLPDPRDAELFKDVEVPLPKTFSQSHLERMPAFLKKSLNRTWVFRDIPTPEKHQEFIKQYLRCIAGVDRSVGQLMGTIDRMKHGDNTLVAYSSDHGMFLGEHGFIGKWLMHEESIRVPFILRHPETARELRGTALEPMVLSIDLAPTILDAAGLEVPAAMDGRSVRPLLLGAKLPWRKDFFYEHHYHHGGRIARSEGVRAEDWAYMTYFDVEPKYEELYDLRHDALQEYNRASDPKYRARLATMRARYERIVSQLPPAVVPAKTP